jgi:WD40 repeat protein
MFCLHRQREDFYLRRKYTPGESGQPDPSPKVSSAEPEHPHTAPTTDSKFWQVGGTRVNPIERHTECPGLTIMFLSPDYMSVVRYVNMEILISNGVLALHPFLPLFAISTEKGRKILIYRISLDDEGPSDPVLLETLNGHNRKITAISFCKSPDSVIQIASGDEYGNVMVHQMDLERPNSAQCVGILENTLPDYCIDRPYPQITSIDWLENTILLSGHRTIWKIHSPIVSNPIGAIWKITTPCLKKSPPNLDAVSFGKFGVKLVCMHPSKIFFAVGIDGFSKYVRSIKIYDAATLEEKCTFESPLGVYSMQFNGDGSKLLLGCTKGTIVLNVQPNGAAMTLLSRIEVGHTRHVSSVIMRQTDQGHVVLSADLTGQLIQSKLPL